ncbi:MAG: glycosyltransferase [Planctomycetes bacterium]|nr:glycosyltransferase [Planctomycetota bacterium]
MSSASGTEPYVILIPVFNDWQATAMLLARLDRVLLENHFRARVLLIDDASTEPPPEHYLRAEFQALGPMEILELRRNLGHQRAIAIGLSYVQANLPCEAVVVMDGDGEDDPQDVPRLIRRFKQAGGNKIVFAQRRKRSESLVFQAFYFLYRVLHQLLTGAGINVGNFSIVPFEALHRLVGVAELWNHYAGAVFKARLPHDLLPTERARRLAGRPRMNFVGLVMHGLSAIAIQGDIVGVRLLVATTLVILTTLAGLLTVLGIRLGTHLAIPGWATYAAGLLLVLLFQAIMISFLFIFIILHNRQGANFLPIRDYHYFLLRIRNLPCQP